LTTTDYSTLALHAALPILGRSPCPARAQHSASFNAITARQLQAHVRQQRENGEAHECRAHEAEHRLRSAGYHLDHGLISRARPLIERSASIPSPQALLGENGACRRHRTRTPPAARSKAVDSVERLTRDQL